MTKNNDGGCAANSKLNTTRDLILELRRVNPKMSSVAIATAAGVSRQRAHQLLRSLNLATVIPAPKAACPQCGEQMPASRAFCSRACRQSASRTSFFCNGCGQLVNVLKSNFRARVRRGSDRFFCTRVCRAQSGRSRRGGGDV